MPKSNRVGVSHAGQAGTVVRADGVAEELRTPDVVEVAPSVGNSSLTSPKSTASESNKSGETDHKPAPMTRNRSNQGRTAGHTARSTAGDRTGDK